MSWCYHCDTTHGAQGCHHPSNLAGYGSYAHIECSCSDCKAKDKRITELEGAAAADTDRLKAAAKRAGVQYVGCDTPEHLADEIERLREVVDAAKAMLPHSKGKVCDWPAVEIFEEKLAALEGGE